jgi:hypothetical protein
MRVLILLPIFALGLAAQSKLAPQERLRTMQRTFRPEVISTTPVRPSHRYCVYPAFATKSVSVKPCAQRRSSRRRSDSLSIPRFGK